MARAAKTGRPAPLDDQTLVALYGLGMAITLTGAVHVAGPLSAGLAGRGWASPTREPIPTVIVALVEGPQSTFTPPPPAWLFYTLTAVLEISFLIGILWAATRLRLGEHTGGAQWGGRRVEKNISVPEAPHKRPHQMAIARGQRTGKILAPAKNISATVFGMPGSAKTTGLVLPAAAEWQGPAVITTAKASDLDAIYARRRHLGPVWIIAPAGIPGRRTHRWSNVDYCTDAKAADRMAAWMAEASSSSGDKRAAPWVDQARTVLKGILLAAHLSGGGVPTMRRWLQLGPNAVDYVRAQLLEHNYDDVADDYAAGWRLHDDGIGSVQFTLNVLARVYDDEEVRSTCSGTDWTVADLLDRNGTVCLIASESDAERFAPLLTSLTASIIHGAEARYTATGRPLDPPLGLFIDEAGNMLRYPRLPNILTTGRGMGIVLLTVWHDLSQLRETLGQQKANTVLSASGVRALLPGCGDLETLRYFSTLYGRTEIRRDTHTRSRGGDSGVQSSIAETDLAPIHMLQQLETFTAVVQSANLPPVQARMRLTWRDKDLKRYLAIPAPQAVSLTKPTDNSRHLKPER